MARAPKKRAPARKKAPGRKMETRARCPFHPAEPCRCHESFPDEVRSAEAKLGRRAWPVEEVPGDWASARARAEARLYASPSLLPGKTDSERALAKKFIFQLIELAIGYQRRGIPVTGVAGSMIGVAIASIEDTGMPESAIPRFFDAIFALTREEATLHASEREHEREVARRHEAEKGKN